MPTEQEEWLKDPMLHYMTYKPYEFDEGDSKYARVPEYYTNEVVIGALNETSKGIDK